MAPARALVAISGAVVAGLLVTRLLFSSELECAPRRLQILVSVKLPLISLILFTDKQPVTEG